VQLGRGVDRQGEVRHGLNLATVHADVLQKVVVEIERPREPAATAKLAKVFEKALGKGMDRVAVGLGRPFSPLRVTRTKRPAPWTGP
jgi:hypothetical protein